MQMTRTLFIFALALAAITTGSSQTDEAPIAAILEELKSLRSKVDSLEKRLETLESPSTQQADVGATMNEKEKTTWINRLRTDLRKAEFKAIGGWTEATNWEKISDRMSEKAVLEILGDPTRSKLSIRKDTDMIHIYEGDIDGSGKLIKGEVRVRKGKVSEIQRPEF